MCLRVCVAFEASTVRYKCLLALCIYCSKLTLEKFLCGSSEREINFNSILVV